MKITPILDTRHKMKDGTYPIKIRVHILKRQYYKNLGISVKDSEWKNGAVIGRMATPFNMLINKNVLSITTDITTLLCNNGSVTDADIRGIIGCKEEETEEHLVIDIANSIADSVKPSTGKVYRGVISNIGKNVPGFDTMRTVDITRKWVNSLVDTFDGRSQSYKHLVVAIVKMCHKKAMEKGYAVAEVNPFCEVKIKQERHIKKALTVEQLRRLIALPHDKYIDLFLLSFYLCGMNLKDIASTPLSCLDAMRIDKNREKTGQPIHVAIQPEAFELIERMKGDVMLTSVTEESSYDNILQYISRRLNNAKDDEGYICRGASMYWARHTWATIASYLDINERTMSMALSHADNSMNAVYIDYNYQKVDDANRKVIDYVLRKER